MKEFVDVNTITCFKEDEDGPVYCTFDQWLKDNNGTTWEEIHCRMLEDDEDEDAISDAREELMDEFNEFCEAWDVEGIEI
jgi:hypothetical protein